MIVNRHKDLWHFVRQAWKAQGGPYEGNGFSIGYTRYHYELEYREGDRRLLLVAEANGGRKWWDVWTTIYFPLRPAWQPPFDSELIDELKADQIRVNLETAANALGWAYEIKMDDSNPIFEPSGG